MEKSYPVPRPLGSAGAGIFEAANRMADNHPYNMALGGNLFREGAVDGAVEKAPPDKGGSGVGFKPREGERSG